MSTREKAGHATLPGSRAPARATSHRPRSLKCRLQVRAGRVELGPDGRSLEVHYEVSLGQGLLVAVP